MHQMWCIHVLEQDSMTFWASVVNFFNEIHLFGILNLSNPLGFPSLKT
jgi:hypothetical protein